MVKIANGIPVYVSLDESRNFNFDLQELESKITTKTKLLVLCNPSNPTGTMIDRDNLAALSEVCIRHDLLVIADEAYERVIYDGTNTFLLASLPVCSREPSPFIPFLRVILCVVSALAIWRPANL